MENELEYVELKVGMEVRGEDEAYRLYCEYAMRKGFSVRKGNIRHGSGGVILQREYLCANAGYYRDGDPSEPKKIRRLVMRTGCKGLIRFSITNDVWKISHFNDEHNHEFVVPEERKFLRINRKMGPASANVVNKIHFDGVRCTNHLSKESGGSGNVGFMQRDYQSSTSHQKKPNLIERADAQGVMNHFKHGQIEDQMFFHGVELDEEGRLANFFWRDGRSKLDYDFFGDGVIFDTTFQTSKYGAIFAPFVGVNHHRKNILFGCGFLLNETIDAFVWLFETFLEAMGNQPPKMIFTNQCQVMANAIKKVFPNTCHLLCLWHISKNASQKIGSLYANSDFKSLFNKFLNSETEDELQSTWDEMIMRFDLVGNKWLESLYELRKKWCPAFCLDTFTPLSNSTQRSESMSSNLHKMSCTTMSLTELVYHYEEQCEKMRLAENKDDFRSKHGTVQAKVKGSKLLKQAADVYTVSVYNLFEDEFLLSLIVHLDQLCSLNTLHTYRVFEEGHSKHYITKFDSSNRSVVCSCKMFESTGWLCRHALKVLNMWNIMEIPSPYILNRWTKRAKEGIDLYEHGEWSTKRKSSFTLERNALFQQLYCAISHLAMTTEGKNLAKKKIEEMWEDAKKLTENCNMNVDNDDFVSGDSDTMDTWGDL